MADEMAEARARMIAKRFGGNAAGANVGGMRKNKGTHKSVGGETMWTTTNNSSEQRATT
jgi:hypothetical protein